MADDIKLLQKYRRQIPVPVETLAHNLGLGLETEADLSEGISGLIQREGDGYVIKAARGEHEYRRRFTIAHEIGHYMLHKSLLDEAGGTNDNTMYRNDINGRAYNSHINDFHERQANSFAANLLMPEEEVRRVWSEKSQQSSHPEELPTLTEMHRHFRVSPSAMRWRLKNLELAHLG